MQSTHTQVYSKIVLHLFFKYIFTCSFLLSTYFSFSQKNNIDSLSVLLKKEKEDTNKVNNLNKLSREYINVGRYDTALHYSNIALQVAQKLIFKNGIANSYNILGNVNREQGNYSRALNYFLKALKIDEEQKDKNGMAKRFGNIGIVYKEQGDYAKSLDYYFKALKMAEDLGNKQVQATILGNIGTVYEEQSDFQKALYRYFKVLKMDEEIGNKDGIARILGNIGSVYKDQKEYTQALEYSFKALKLDEEIGNKDRIARNLGNIGESYSATKKYTEAEKYLLQALAIDTTIGALTGIMYRQQALSELYEKMGKPAKALEHFKKTMMAKDTLFNANKNKEITSKEMNYEFEKMKAEQEKKDAVQESEDRRQRAILIMVSVFLILVLIFSGFVFRSLRITRKQNHIIELQKQKVEEHQKEIIDSITYAKRLQDAILPPLHFVKKHLPDSFVLYLPKDIVAGDFYWMEIIDNTIFVAAADCTGHGVSGAIISVVCSNALNRTVNEFGLRDTGKILDKVTELVVETFEKSDKNVMDGMDISLLSINKSSGQINWSGANNALWYIQNGIVNEITPDKQPIGKYDYLKPFTTHTICLPPTPSFRGGEVLPEGQPQVASEAHLGGASTFYLFTDGYADQFGGPKGKKFKYKQLNEKLLAISQQPLAKQNEELLKIFNDWKGSLDQVDDVCIIGIKI